MIVIVDSKKLTVILVYSIVIDLVLAGLPWAIVWTLNMKKKEKLNIALSLSLGVFAAICGIVRTYELQGLSRVTDYSYGTVSLVLWSASELLITIICANIPMLRPLFTRKAGSTREGSDMPNPTIGSNRFGGGRKKGEDILLYSYNMLSLMLNIKTRL